MKTVADHIYLFVIRYGVWIVPIAPMIEFAEARGGEIADWFGGASLELVGIMVSHGFLNAFGSKMKVLVPLNVLAIVAYLALGVLTVGFSVDWASASIFVLSAIAYFSMGLHYVREQEKSDIEAKKKERKERRKVTGKLPESSGKAVTWRQLTPDDKRHLLDLSTTEAATEYNVSERTVRNWKIKLNGAKA